MIRKESKHSVGMGSRIQGGNLEKLISEILKFRDKSLSGRDKSDPPKSADDLCGRDWAQFHDPKNLAEAIGIK